MECRKSTRKFGGVESFIYLCRLYGYNNIHACHCGDNLGLLFLDRQKREPGKIMQLIGRRTPGHKRTLDTKRTVPFVLYCVLGMGEQKKPRSVTARLFWD